MKKPLLFLLLLLASAPALAPGAAAQTSAAPAPSGTPPAASTAAEARQALDTLQNPEARARLIATLKAIAAAEPVVPPATAPAPAAAPAAKPKAAPLVPNSLVGELVTQLPNWVDQISAETVSAARTATDFPRFRHWLEQALGDPATRVALLDGLGKLVLVFGCGLLAEFLIGWALRRPRAAVATHAPAEDDDTAASGMSRGWVAAAGAWRLLRRLPFALARLVLELIPVAAFATVGNLLAGTPLGTPYEARLAILAVVDAYVLTRLIVCLARLLVSPDEGRLRLWHIGAEPAAYVVRWTRRIAAVAVFGGALAATATLLGIDDAMHDTLIRLVALIDAVLLVIVVLQCRSSVARRLAGPPDRHGAFAGLRRALASAWAFMAIIAIAAGWGVWAVGAKDGLVGVAWFFGGTLAVLVAARLLAIVVLGLLDRALAEPADPSARRIDLDARAQRYYRPLRAVLTGVIAAIAAVALLQLWGLGALAWFAGDTIGGRLLSAAITIAIAAAAAIVVWEGANAALDRRLDRLSQDGGSERAARLRTLRPILRTALLGTIATIVGLTALSEIGVNIAPLLAGAGIVGIAIGFGSQKLVQDVITGLFLLFENAIRVGDEVTVAGLSGTVEHLSIRTMWLRSSEGSVHIVPFSSVTSITNTNRGIGNATITVTVAYHEDTDRVGTLLGEIAAAMKRDPQFGPLLRGELDLWGVDKLSTAGGVTLVGRIQRTDAGRWPVQREFYRRLKQRFEEAGIDIVSAG